MKRLNKLFLIVSASTLCGCSGIQSSVHFTRGTQCIEKGDFQGARFHLEKACELDPSMSRNHNNLTYIYIQLGEIDKAWYHARQAAFLDPGNEEAVTNFNNLLDELETFYNIAEGSSKEDVKAALGEPDMDSEDHDCTLRYGLALLVFKDGKLIEKTIISGVKGVWIIASPT